MNLSKTVTVDLNIDLSTPEAFAAILENGKSFFTPEYRETAAPADILGISISKHCEFNGQAIIDTFLSALEDANYHAFYELVEAARNLEPAQLRAIAVGIPADL